MAEPILETLKYSSYPKTYKKNYKFGNISTTDSIKCNLAVKSIKKDKKVRIRINFDWDDKEIEKVTGTVTMSFCPFFGIFSASTGFETCAEVEKPGSFIEKIFDAKNFDFTFSYYEYSLTIHRPPRERALYDKMFAPSSEQTDAVLLIGEKKLHVSKTFLSYHSAYFRRLFAEHKAAGIPIEDVTYDEFGLLMSIVYPDMAVVTCKTIEPLLKLGQRFEMPAVMHHVENMLLNSYLNFTNGWSLILADKYNLQKVLEKTIPNISLGEYRDLNGYAEYSQLSDSTKSKILDCVAKTQDGCILFFVFMYVALVVCLLCIPFVCSI